jgi:(1->4)-alpha-D-glucan 1-alpha-D-glucosylmutase
LRRQNSEAFEKGAYIPLEVIGRHKDHVLAFARNHKKLWVVTIAPRFFTGLVVESEYPLGKTVWSDTHIRLPDDFPHSWINMMTNQAIKSEDGLTVGDVLKDFPVALVVNEEDK